MSCVPKSDIVEKDNSLSIYDPFGTHYNLHSPDHPDTGIDEAVIQTYSIDATEIIRSPNMPLCNVGAILQRQGNSAWIIQSL